MNVRGMGYLAYKGQVDTSAKTSIDGNVALSRWFSYLQLYRLTSDRLVGCNGYGRVCRRTSSIIFGLWLTIYICEPAKTGFLSIPARSRKLDI